MGTENPNAGQNPTADNAGKKTGASEPTFAQERAAEQEAFGAAIAKGIAEGLRGQTAGAPVVGVGSDDSRVPADPEERLDFAPNGGVFAVSDDEDSPLVNSWGTQVEEDGTPIERKATRGRRR